MYKKAIHKISLFTLLSLGMSFAHADILVDTATSKAEDICEQIEGTWVGGGVVSLGLSCNYKGTVTIQKTGNATEFDMQVVFHKDSGSFLCPTDENLPLHGSCKNGAINIQTSAADLKGNLSEGGKKANVNGTIKYSIFNLKADIELRK